MRAKRLTVIALCASLGIAPMPAKADLRQFGDAMADVATFGAWGQSRDLANAEIKRLKLRFQEELKRAENKGGALIATTRLSQPKPPPKHIDDRVGRAGGEKHESKKGECTHRAVPAACQR